MKLSANIYVNCLQYDQNCPQMLYLKGTLDSSIHGYLQAWSRLSTDTVSVTIRVNTAIIAGDGANDVSMIQTADIGVGISGQV